jgi:hypothetical protein
MWHGSDHHLTSAGFYRATTVLKLPSNVTMSIKASRYLSQFTEEKHNSEIRNYSGRCLENIAVRCLHHPEIQVPPRESAPRDIPLRLVQPIERGIKQASSRIRRRCRDGGLKTKPWEIKIVTLHESFQSMQNLRGRNHCQRKDTANAKRLSSLLETGSASPTSFSST